MKMKMKWMRKLTVFLEQNDYCDRGRMICENWGLLELFESDLDYYIIMFEINMDLNRSLNL